MVSAAKLRRAQERVINARPFADKMREMLENLASQTSDDFHHPLLDVRGDQRYRVFLITADKGLCGGFNANLIKATQVFLKQHADKDIELVTIGRKGRDFFRRQRMSWPASSSASPVKALSNSPKRCTWRGNV